ncbi:MAG TPA: cytosolic protein, partial [Chloroflexota bacterium]|nr:cytosolic protein [Chloroflexota bacterium]
MATPRADFDSPWKDALEEYLEECFLLLFPEAHAAIDWSRSYTFLDTELQQADPDGELGPRRVDKLVRVWLLNGRDAWILVHVEVQSQEEDAFTRRMFIYFARIFDHFNREVVSMAVLADERLGWRPETFSMGRWGFSLQVRFPIVKL